MWLMDHQMNVRVSEEFGMYFARIPLKTSPHIVNGIDNAGLPDFVAAWYVKAARYMTKIPLSPPLPKGEAVVVPHFKKGG